MGKLIVISGPSGVGKGTIINRILEELDNVKLSISCTTRAPRPGEEHGKQYYFITKEEFEQMIADDGFLEYESFFDNCYGTPRKMVMEEVEKGNNIILEIDVKGGMNIKKMEPHALLIFIAPPSFPELKKRLENRKSETPEQIVQRVARATAEMRYSNEYDHVVINDDLEKAVQEVIDYIKE